VSALTSRGGRGKKKVDPDKRLWRTSSEMLVWVQQTYACIFDLDAAALPTSAVAPRFFCPIPPLGPCQRKVCAICKARTAGRRLLEWRGQLYCLDCGVRCFGATWNALAPGAWPERAGFRPNQRIVIWANPPWGTHSETTPGTSAWIDRCLAEYASPQVSLGFILVPAAIDTRWWWNAARAAVRVHELGRIAYRRPDGSVGPSPPQSSTLFVYGADAEARAARLPASDHVVVHHTRITSESAP